MQVSVEKTSELSRKMTVHISEEAISKKMNARIKSLAREIKLDGFRPGKVPLQIVKKRYGTSVKNEIMGDLIQSTYVEAIKSEQLNPAGMPKIKPAENGSESGGFEYSAVFEVYPKVVLEGLDKMQINRANGQLEASDIDETIELLRQQKKTWQEVKRAAAIDDQIAFHFSGVCGEENFTNGKVENHQTILGSGQMIPGFDDELVGLEASATKTFDVVLPEKYGNEKLAGKIATFNVEIVKVEAAELPEVDAEFIKEFGVDDGDVEKFCEQVKVNLENELEQGIKRTTKNNVMGALYDKIQLQVPTVLIDQEIEYLQTSYKADAKRQGQQVADLPRDMFEKQAQRRVAMGLILSEIIQKNEIKVDDERVKETLENMAKSYDSPDEMVKWYYSDKQRLAEIENMVIENQVVDYILGQAEVIEEVLSFYDLSKSQQQ